MQILATVGTTRYPYSQRMPSAIDFAIYIGIRSDFLAISEILKFGAQPIHEPAQSLRL